MLSLSGKKVPKTVGEKEFQRTALRQEIDRLERKMRREKDPSEFEKLRAELNAAKRDLRALG